jgi:uncharacterized protein (TIGR02444 family)
MGGGNGFAQQKMNSDSNRPSAADELWSFSLAFYSRPDAAEALLLLQDKAGLDVNLMLFALWLGVSGRGRVGQDLIAAAQRSVASIRTDLIAPLRALRRRLKTAAEPDIQLLRGRVKTIEIEAERAAQRRLAKLAPAIATADRRVRAADAEANFAVVVGPAGAGRPAAVIGRELRALADALSGDAEPA